ncbi:MAG: ABC transporter ATP-binding protein [Spirochaetaceae bacterium]|jgi:branched-chain amino acid transport system ATP-binding protein|nr:ABC transporter ATP-binding protein [Spirochaetaceae bacterium]
MAEKEIMLAMEDVDVFYGKIQVLYGLSLSIEKGKIVCLLGANGAGKTTILKTILGALRPREGTIKFYDEVISGQPIAGVVKRGIAIVPEGRRIFTKMTVKENLEMGAFTQRDRKKILREMERVFALFPRLRERQNQVGATLSGGEQQMLAMGRALMARPKLILMDEPSMGLAPLLVENLFATIETINKEEGLTVFIVEQNANMALSIADFGYVIQNGNLVVANTAENLRNNEMIRRAYLATG